MGLYAACELALLGHSVSVHESRDETSRLNVLKLWPETERAFSSKLCLNLLDPLYANILEARASTTRLQQALLKAALMLGVQITLRPAGSQFCQFSLRDADGFDALVDAAGHQSGLLETFTREATVSNMLAARDPEPFGTCAMKITCATAIVAHFELTNRTDSAKAWMDGLPSFDWVCSDAKLGDSAPEQLMSKHGTWAVAPNLVASSLRQQLPPSTALSAPSARSSASRSSSSGALIAPLENVILSKNRAHNKLRAAGHTELANLHGAPPSFYWIATLRRATYVVETCVAYVTYAAYVMCVTCVT